MKLTNLFLIAVFSLTTLLGNAQTSNDSAVQHPILSSKFIINAGLYIPSKSLKISANGNSVTNEEIDFGKTFKFGNKEYTFATNFIWRFSKSHRWSVGLEYFKISNRKQTSLDREIEWDDTVYPVGAEVEAGITYSLYRILFGYAISQGEQHEFGVGLGIHAMDIKSFIEGKAYLGDDVGEFDLDKRSVSAIAPVPNLGLWYFYAPHYKWAVTARIDWFAIKINDIDGSLWNLAPGIKFQAWDHIGFGLNYRFFQTKIKVDKSVWDGSINFRFNGPLLTLSANF
jgi:hypothetical protein